MKLEYKGKTVIQHRKKDGDFVYRCDGKTYHSIYELELYIDPSCVASRKKEDIEKRRKNDDNPRQR